MVVAICPDHAFDADFTGLKIVDPGYRPRPLWDPDVAEDVSPDAERIRLNAGLGCKP